MADPSSSGSRPTVVVIGGGYGGYAAAKALDDVAAVTLVEKRDAFVHNVAALRALVDPDWLSSIFLPYDRLLEHGRVIHDRAVEVDVGRVLLASGEELGADYLVLASGSHYPYPAKTDSDHSTVAAARYQRSHDELSEAKRVLILGSGPTGLELAGEISSVWPEKRITILETGADILPGPFDPRLREELHRQLAERGIELLLGDELESDPGIPAASLAPFTVRTRAGRTIDADILFRCFGVTPVSDYLTGRLAAARHSDGYVEVTPQLHLPGQPTVYAVGDISTADYNTAGRAGRQAATAAANIQAHHNDDPLEIYEPLPPVIVIPFGPSGGASQLPGQEAIAGPDATSELKGRHLFVDRYRELFGLEPLPTP